MPEAFETAADYEPAMLRHVRSVCLYLATLLRDHLDDEKYRAISDRLRRAGFRPDEKEDTGNPVLQNGSWI